MDFLLLLKGVIIGIFITAPTGPIAIACMQRTLLRGRLSGIVSGLGATSGDVLYGALVGLGSLSIANFLVSHYVLIKIVSGIILIIWGIKIYFSIITSNDEFSKTRTLAEDYISILLLTLLSPLTILFFPALFANFNILENVKTISVFLVMLGIFFGACLWWVFLCSLLSIFRDIFIKKWLILINKITGILISISGLITLFSLLVHR